jgi:hypothetical protein
MRERVLACRSDTRHIRYLVRHIGNEKTVWINRSNIAQWQEASVSNAAHSTALGSGYELQSKAQRRCSCLTRHIATSRVTQRVGRQHSPYAQRDEKTHKHDSASSKFRPVSCYNPLHAPHTLHFGYSILMRVLCALLAIRTITTKMRGL